jgi:hypothetical protein
MPRYDYRCTACGRMDERQVSQESKDLQVCAIRLGTGEFCEGRMARQCHYGSLVIGIPMAFHFESSDMPEMTPELRRHWDEMGVRRADFREV